MNLSDEYQSMAANAICHAASMAGEEARVSAAQYGRPSVVWKPKLFIDGAKWCALYGENIQEGVAGFGDSPAEAMWDFDNAWSRKLETKSHGDAYPSDRAATHGHLTTEIERWRHIANEWADTACNGLQWLRNVNEGISTPVEGMTAIHAEIMRNRALKDEA